MKSKIFKKHKKEQAKSQVGEGGDIEADDQIDDGTEVEDIEPEVANSKQSKIAILSASSLLIAVVLYFLFFKSGSDNNPSDESLEEVATQIIDRGDNDALPITKDDNIEDIIDFTEDDQVEIFEKPKLPEIPTLPEVPDDLSFNEVVLPVVLDVPDEDNKKIKKNRPQDQGFEEDSFSNNSSGSQQGGSGGGTPNVETVVKDEVLDPRKSPIMVESSGSSVLENDDFSGGIFVLNEDSIDSLNASTIQVQASAVKDLSTTIIQGKIMTAVLETSINTEVPGSVRGIVSRDVYAESGKNILIPKGSRLYGAYSTQVVRGQGRVQINWTRLIRPDGVDLNVGFSASDQFGRAGIEGDINNKYGSIIANSLLTSILAVGGAIAAEKLSGNDSSTTTTNPSDGTSTTSSSPSAEVITDVSKTLIDTVGEVIGNAIDARPIIRVPQGTRLTIVVNADMSIPPVRKQ